MCSASLAPSLLLRWQRLPSGLHLGDKSATRLSPRFFTAKNTLANDLHLTARGKAARLQRDEHRTSIPNLSIPSTPSISTPSSLTLSPITPTQTAPSASSDTDTMAPGIELFRGDGRGDKPHYWLKRLQGAMAHDAVDAAKLYRFEMGLVPGAAAE
ncbi:hypothetical protein B0H10DRAFT_1967778 [Mycena sp. CBHHK59/15]|nr:hypothetical protein B0H10DRAFT_1967778 [Mycena sp. CBHHK59/15]